MTVRQAIPAGLAEMAPGPELSALLAGIDIHALSGNDAVEVLQAQARQLSHEQARLLATMVEIGLCDPEATGDQVARLAESPRYAGDEIRAALAWTHRAADHELLFAETLVLQMPAVFTALDTGRIDRNKAWTSPLGRTYHTQPPPITHDLPDPLPRPAEPNEPSLLLPYDDGPILERPPPPLTPPDPNEPPPF